MDPATFLTELKRRKVYRVAVAYAIVAWLLVQAASILFPTFEAPPWVMKVFVTAVILGFSVARYTRFTYSNIHQQTRVGALGTNGFFDCGSRKAAWRSSILLPLLQCSLRDL